MACIDERHVCLQKNSTFLGFSLKHSSDNKCLYRGKEENKPDGTASNSNQSVLALLYIIYISDTPAPAPPLHVGWADAALRPSPGDTAVPCGGDTGGGRGGGVIYTTGAHTYIFIVSGERRAAARRGTKQSAFIQTRSSAHGQGCREPGWGCHAGWGGPGVPRSLFPRGAPPGVRLALLAAPRGRRGLVGSSPDTSDCGGETPTPLRG